MVVVAMGKAVAKRAAVLMVEVVGAQATNWALWEESQETVGLAVAMAEVATPEAAMVAVVAVEKAAETPATVEVERERVVQVVAVVSKLVGSRCSGHLLLHPRECRRSEGTRHLAHTRMPCTFSSTRCRQHHTRLSLRR